jgi:hypothetical protein
LGITFMPRHVKQLKISNLTKYEPTFAIRSQIKHQ